MKSAYSPHIVFAGAATIDMIFSVNDMPEGPGKILPKAFLQVAHGMATSAAVAAVRLGGRASLISRIGDDTLGDRFIQDISAEGVDCHLVCRFKGARTPISAVIVDDTGERLVVPYYDNALGTNPGWIPDALIQAADAVQVDVRWAEGAERVLSLARAGGKIAVLDADVGPPEVTMMLAQLASHSIFSAPAALLVSGAACIEDALHEISQLCDGFIAVTDGARGCFWLVDGTLQQLRPPQVKVVDTLAAGDVFHGAFTLAVAEGMPIAKAIQFANAAAAIKCESFGGRLGSPTRQAVLACLARHPEADAGQLL